MNDGFTGSALLGSLLVAIPLFSDFPAQNSSSIRIQRVMAFNCQSAADEAGDFEDYIELANPTDEPIEVGGMYLSDDASNPRRWRIPTDTVVPASATLRIWADGEPGEGPLHACFRLNRNGERVMLFDTDEASNQLVDAVIFPRQQADETFAHRGPIARNGVTRQSRSAVVLAGSATH